jgi:hypothetical protein
MYIDAICYVASYGLTLGPAPEADSLLATNPDTGFASFVFLCEAIYTV